MVVSFQKALHKSIRKKQISCPQQLNRRTNRVKFLARERGKFWARISYWLGWRYRSLNQGIGWVDLI